MNDKVKVQNGERVLYVNKDAVENMKKFGFESAEAPKKEVTRKRTTKNKNTEVVSNESGSK